MDDFELELKQDFLIESEDLLESAESAFLRLESERDNAELMNEIFRLAHNLKGTAKAVGFDQLSELTHVAENLILKLKEGSLEVSDSIVSTLLEFKDKVNEMIEELKADINASFDIKSLQLKIENEIVGSPTPISDKTQNSSDLEENFIDHEIEDAFEESNSNIPEANDDRFEEKEEVKVATSVPVSDAAIESLRESGFDEETIKQMLADDSSFSSDSGQSENLDNLNEIKTQGLAIRELPTDSKLESTNVFDIGEQQEVHAKEPSEDQTSKKKTQQATESEESIRVKLSRIDKINNIIGELVILQTVISQRRYQYIEDDLSNKSIGMMGKLFKDVQEIAMSLRMLPLKATFQKMTRIVRDTSKVLGKDVNLHLVGEDTEVDKTVLEKLADPLVHIVRNAVDHGLETPEERISCGKDAKGNVELFAFHEGSNLVIQVTDDGKGIDPNIIREKAIEKGIIKRSSLISDQEVIQLIFHPGFSTKEQVTEVSGRGVGMDVVKTNIEKLGGEVKLMSKVGEGSSLKIILPLTLAIIEGIVIKAQEDKFVLPLSQVYEISQIKPNEIESFSGVVNLFRLRGEVLPLFFVNHKIGKKSKETESALTVVVVRGLNYAFGVVVDDILNQQQIVIKKLGEDIRGKKGIIGSAIMADGMPSLILDLFELFKDDLKESRGHQKYRERNLKTA